MKYQVHPYKEDKPFVVSILGMMQEHAGERLGASNYSPDIPKILGLWKLGVLQLVTIADETTLEIVGYQGWLCSNQLTNTALKQATLSYIFMSKHIRGNQEQFLSFVQYGVSAMKLLGAQDILAGVDGDQPWLREKLALAGFTVERARQLSYTGG